MFNNSHNLVFTNGTFTNTVVNNYNGIGSSERIEAGPGERRKPREPKVCPLPVPTFIGRKDMLDKMTTFFDAEGGSQRVFVLHGLGGSGKSQLAFRFLQESKSNRFSEIFYVDATNEQTLRMDLEALVPGHVEPSAEAGLRRLASQPRDAKWALFFDNADDVNLKLAKFFPPCTSGNIIVTTRNQDLRILAGRNGDIKVTDMEDDEAKHLLLELSDAEHTMENDAIAAQIVQDLHCFALAISQAGGYIRVNSSLSDYQRLYRSERDHLLQNVEFQGQDPYEYAVYATWRLSYDKLDTSSKTLLHICSLLHHEGISEEMFERAALCQLERWEEVEVGDLSQAIELLNQLGKQDMQWSSYKFRQVVKQLASYSLLQYNQQNSAYSIHPLVQHWSCTTLGTEQYGMHKHIITIICLSTPQETNTSVKDDNYRRTLIKHTTKHPNPTNLTLIMCHCLSLIYEDNGLWREVEKLREEELSKQKLLQGDNHPSTLISMGNLAVIYKALGRLKDAEVLEVQVLQKRKLLLGEDHPVTLISMGNLAETYRNQGMLKNAEVLGVHVLEKSKFLLGDDHPSTLMSMGNLARTYSALGRPKDAEMLDVQVLQKRKLLLGEDHPDTVEGMANLAAINSILGHQKDAEVLGIQVLQKKRLLLGDDHPSTLISMSNLAVIYKTLGRLKDAEVQEVQVLDKMKPLLGEDHLLTLTCMGNLAATYSALGRQKDAEVLRVQVLEKRKLLLGEDHPDTLKSIHSLAATYRVLGRQKDAEVLEVQVLQKRRLLLGEDHPDTLLSMANLAATYGGLDRWKDAEVLEVQVLQKRKLLLGEDHPHTLISMGNLAATYNALGHQKDAEVLELLVLEKRKLLLGEHHPHTLISMGNLSHRYRKQGRLEEAEALESEMNALKRETQSPDEEPDTFAST